MANAVVKSYSSFAVNEGLLAKIVDAVRQGEREARRYGQLRSFEVFYHGHRINLVLGRIMIIPAKIADSIDDFPTSLLYGAMMKELSSESIAEIFTYKMGESEFDEYDKKDLAAIKDKLFKDVDGNYRSLIMFLPTWGAPRDYVSFKMVHDEEKLCMLLRHLVFASYFNPALSSSFEALSTDVQTERIDVTDVTPKLSHPFLAENLIKSYPELQPGDVKTASKRLPKMMLTAANVDAIKEELLDPGEIAVLNELSEEITAHVDHEVSTSEEIQKQAADFGPDQHAAEEDALDASPFSGVSPAIEQRENLVRDWVAAHDGEIPEALYLDVKTGLVGKGRPEHVHYYRYPTSVIQRVVGQTKEASVEPVAKVAATPEEIVQQIKQYARDHYNEGGWDYVVETMDDSDIRGAVANSDGTFEGTIKALGQEFGMLNDYRDDIRGAGDADAEQRQPQVPADLGQDGKWPSVEEIIAEQKKNASVDDKGATTGLRNRPDYGEEGSYTSEANKLAEKGASIKTAGSMTWGVYFDGGGFQWTVFESGLGKPKVVAKGTSATQEEADAAIQQHVSGKGKLFNNRLASKTASAISDIVLGYVEEHGGVVPQTLFVNLDKKYCSPERPNFGYIYVSKAETERMQRAQTPTAPLDTRAYGYSSVTASSKTASVKVAAPVKIMERSGSQLIRTGSVLTAKSPTGYTETVRINGTKIKWAMPNRFAISFRQTAETLIRNPRFASTLKVADVPQTFEDIWGEKMDDMGPAPQVELKVAPINESVSPSSDSSSPAEHTAPAATEEKPAEKKDEGAGDDDPKPPTGGGKPEEKKEEGGEEKKEEGGEEKKDEWQKPWEKEAAKKSDAAFEEFIKTKKKNDKPKEKAKKASRIEKLKALRPDLVTKGFFDAKVASDEEWEDSIDDEMSDEDMGKFFDAPENQPDTAESRLPAGHPMKKMLEKARKHASAIKTAAAKVAAIGNCDLCSRSVTASTGSEVGPNFFLHAACQAKGKKMAQNGLVAYQVLARYYPDVLRKVADREFIDAAMKELSDEGQLSTTLSFMDLMPTQQQQIFERARKIKDREQGNHFAAFNMFIPGQVAQEFAPDVLRETVDYPNDSYSPMISDVGPQADGAYVSTSPAGGLGIGADGKPQVLDGAPLRKENDIRGYMFDQEFYQQYDGIDGTGMRAASALAGVKKTAGADEFKAQFADFLKKTMGEVAATFMAGFKVTMRPMMNKVPGVGEINLQTIEQPTLQQMNAYNIPNVSSRVRFLVSKLNDSDIKDAINDGWSQASVWNSDENGGYNYEVFVRPETLDPDTLILTYSFVVGTKGL